MAYTVHDALMPKNLIDISNEQVQDHWNLYKGYVMQVNTLHAELAQMSQDGHVGSLTFADRRRRFGFEYNGMVLHEYYFGNLIGGEHELRTTSDLYRTIVDSFGSYDAWKANFEAASKTRGIGWAILYADPMTGQLTNHFIAEHQNGNIAGFQPILVLDVWEHAYMVDHRAGGRGTYIAAFMKNIHWEQVEMRYADVRDGKISKRF